VTFFFSSILCRASVWIRLLLGIFVLLRIFISGALAGTADYPVLTAAIPPYTTAKAGEVGGIVTDVFREMARRVGHAGRIEMTAWNRAQQEVRSPQDGTPRFIIPLTRTPEREKLYQWVAPLLSDDALIVTLKGARPPVTSRKQLAGVRTGALLGSPLEALLRAEGLGVLDAAPNEETNARKLASGHIGAWFVARLVAPEVFTAEGFDPARLDYGIVLRRNDLYLAASPAMPPGEIRKWKAAFLEMKKDGTWKRITRR
jgi:polar amino acid transport system substrate-binding protein